MGHPQGQLGDGITKEEEGFLSSRTSFVMTCRSWSLRVIQKIAGDDGALDFAGTFVDGDNAGVAIHALDVGFARVAEAAVDLDGFVDDAIDHFAGVEFRAGGGEAWPATRDP